MADTPHVTRTQQAKRDTREKRLANALRQNLLRRKEQSRDRRSLEDSDALQEEAAVEPSNPFA